MCAQIFTNADKAHAHQVLERLGLEDCFEGIICFETLNPPPALAADTDDALHLQSRVLCKPSPEAFDAAFDVANINPDKTVKTEYRSSLFFLLHTSHNNNICILIVNLSDFRRFSLTIVLKTLQQQKDFIQ